MVKGLEHLAKSLTEAKQNGAESLVLRTEDLERALEEANERVEQDIAGMAKACRESNARFEREATYARDEERARAAEIAKTQPLYFDTKSGMRQQWVKAEIARKILEPSVGTGADVCMGDDAPTPEEIADAREVDETFTSVGEPIVVKRYSEEEFDRVKTQLERAGLLTSASDLPLARCAHTEYAEGKRFRCTLADHNNVGRHSLEEEELPF